MASAKVLQMKAKPRPAQLLCSGCGVSAEAQCDCGMAYVPAAKVAAKAVARNPQKSNRAIAADLGISDMTVQRARKQLQQNVAVGATSAVEAGRIGLDGKYRSMPRKEHVEAAQQLTPAERSLAEQRYKAKLLHREVSRTTDEAVSRILAFGNQFPNMEAVAREAFTTLLLTSSQRLADAEREFNKGVEP